MNSHYTPLAEPSQAEMVQLPEFKSKDTVEGFNLNAGFLPLICGFEINRLGRPKFAAKKKRAKELLKWLHNTNADVICLQEIFDVKIADFLISQLRQKGYYHARGISVPTSQMGPAQIPEVLHKIDFLCPSVINQKDEVNVDCGLSSCTVVKAVRGGLLFFSKLPILEIAGDVFTSFNPHVFDVIVQKGFMAVKLKLNDAEFITLYLSHLGAGGPRVGNEPSNSERRSQELEQIYHHTKGWAEIAPPGHSHLQHAATFFAADTNINLAPDVIDDHRIDDRRMRSIKAVPKNQPVNCNNIKYSGQNLFFSHFQPVVPDNFVNTAFRDERGKRYIDASKLQQVKDDVTLYTCTDNPDQTGDAARFETHKLLDIVTIDKNAQGAITTNIANGSRVSDHHAILFTYQRHPASQQKWTSIYDDQNSDNGPPSQQMQLGSQA